MEKEMDALKGRERWEKMYHASRQKPVGCR